MTNDEKLQLQPQPQPIMRMDSFPPDASKEMKDGFYQLKLEYLSKCSKAETELYDAMLKLYKKGK